MSWKQTQTRAAADEGIEAIMILIDEWVAHRLGLDEQSDLSDTHPPRPETQLERGEFIDLCFIYIFNFFSHSVHLI